MALFCSDYSRMAGEQVFGTVKPVDAWFLIEHRARWERDALAASPDAVRRLVENIAPRTRTTLIRQPHRTRGPLAAFLAITSETGPGLFEFEVNRPEDLL